MGNLQGDSSLEPWIPGGEHASHRALTEGLLDHVAANGPTSGQLDGKQGQSFGDFVDLGGGLHGLRTHPYGGRAVFGRYPKKKSEGC